jgi:opacity protein-like surface antigen
MRSLRGGIVVLALLAGSAAAAVAQETGTPVFEAPHRLFESHEFGGALADPGDLGDLSLEGFYRFANGPHDFSVRAGFLDRPGDTGFLLGGDFRTRVLSYSESFPLDGALTLGLGGIFGGDFDDIVLLPVGISLGRRFDVEGSSTRFVPYVHPNIVPVFGGEGDDVEFTLGLGVDIKFGDQWAVRASGGLGDIEGVGITLAYLR